MIGVNQKSSDDDKQAFPSSEDSFSRFLSKYEVISLLEHNYLTFMLFVHRKNLHKTTINYPAKLYNSLIHSSYKIFNTV